MAQLVSVQGHDEFGYLDDLGTCMANGFICEDADGTKKGPFTIYELRMMHKNGQLMDDDIVSHPWIGKKRAAALLKGHDNYHGPPINDTPQPGTATQHQPQHQAAKRQPVPGSDDALQAAAVQAVAAAGAKRVKAQDGNVSSKKAKPATAGPAAAGKETAGKEAVEAKKPVSKHGAAAGNSVPSEIAAAAAPDSQVEHGKASPAATKQPGPKPLPINDVGVGGKAHAASNGNAAPAGSQQRKAPVTSVTAAGQKDTQAQRVAGKSNTAAQKVGAVAAKAVGAARPTIGAGPSAVRKNAETITFSSSSEDEMPHAKAAPQGRATAAATGAGRVAGGAAAKGKKRAVLQDLDDDESDGDVAAFAKLSKAQNHKQLKRLEATGPDSSPAGVEGGSARGRGAAKGAAHGSGPAAAGGSAGRADAKPVARRGSGVGTAGPAAVSHAAAAVQNKAAGMASQPGTAKRHEGPAAGLSMRPPLPASGGSKPLSGQQQQPLRSTPAPSPAVQASARPAGTTAAAAAAPRPSGAAAGALAAGGSKPLPKPPPAGGTSLYKRPKPSVASRAFGARTADLPEPSVSQAPNASKSLFEAIDELPEVHRAEFDELLRPDYEASYTVDGMSLEWKEVSVLQLQDAVDKQEVPLTAMTYFMDTESMGLRLLLDRHRKQIELARRVRDEGVRALATAPRSSFLIPPAALPAPARLSMPSPNHWQQSPQYEARLASPVASPHHDTAGPSQQDMGINLVRSMFRPPQQHLQQQHHAPSQTQPRSNSAVAPRFNVVIVDGTHPGVVDPNRYRAEAGQTSAAFQPSPRPFAEQSPNPHAQQQPQQQQQQHFLSSGLPQGSSAALHPSHRPSPQQAPESIALPPPPQQQQQATAALLDSIPQLYEALMAAQQQQQQQQQANQPHDQPAQQQQLLLSVLQSHIGSQQQQQQQPIAPQQQSLLMSHMASQQQPDLQQQSLLLFQALHQEQQQQQQQEEQQQQQQQEDHYHHEEQELEMEPEGQGLPEAELNLLLGFGGGGQGNGEGAALDNQIKELEEELKEDMPCFTFKITPLDHYLVPSYLPGPLQHEGDEPAGQVLQGGVPAAGTADAPREAAEVAVIDILEDYDDADLYGDDG